MQEIWQITHFRSIGITYHAETVRWITRSAECRKCEVWKMRSVENAVWKMKSVENAECRKCENEKKV